MRERIVSVADWAVDAGDAVLITLGLGSCVAIALYDEQARAGGLAHVLLPSQTLSGDRTRPAKFPETAVPFLVDRAVECGASARRLRARIVGGASMFAAAGPPGVAGIGGRNVQAVTEMLGRAGIPLVAHDTGGDHGRSVYLFLESGRLEVRSYAHGVRVL